MSAIQRKVWRDLARNKVRTLLVVLSTTVGLFALGLVFGLSNLMQARIQEDFQARHPAHLTFWGGSFDRETLDLILEEPGVAEVTGETRVGIRWKKAGETEWRNASLIALPDYGSQRMNLIDLERGAWPGERTLALERMSAGYYNLPVGSQVLVESGRSEKIFPVSGVTRSPNTYPPQFGGDATFYSDQETVSWLTGLEYANLAQVRLDQFDPEVVEAVARRVENRLDRMGRPIGGHFVTDPNVYPGQDTLNTLMLILAVLGALSLGLGAFLIINTMNAIIAQQVWQIGVMKVVGATIGRVARVYLLTALVYGVLACLIAVPLGVFGANWMAAWMLDYINIGAGPFRVLPDVIVLQVLLGIGVPMLAALVPALSGALITPHQAISNYGLGAGFGRSPFDRLIGAIRGLPRPVALSLRNTFRRKLRVALTLLTLALGGVMFIVVMSVRTSLDKTLEVVINQYGMDVWVIFNEPHRSASLVEIANRVPGVVRAEVWDQREAKLSLASGAQRTIYLIGLPADSEIFRPRLVAGRMLLPEDEYAVLLNNKIAADEGYQVGDKVAVTVNERETAWTIVGLILDVSNNQMVSYVPFTALSRETGNFDRGVILTVQSEQHNPQVEAGLIRQLRAVFTANGYRPAALTSASEIRQLNRTQFNIITYLMLAMSILAAVVGSFGLTGTMSINVIERSREIGVMRAIGAGSPSILGIFVVEGLLLGLLSWILALPFSYPGAQIFCSMIGQALLKIPLDFQYSLDGTLIWLGVVAGLSVLSSLLPAFRATQFSVRAALAYE